MAMYQEVELRWSTVAFGLAIYVIVVFLWLPLPPIVAIPLYVVAIGAFLWWYHPVIVAVLSGMSVIEAVREIPGFVASAFRVAGGTIVFVGPLLAIHWLGSPVPLKTHVMFLSIGLALDWYRARR